MSEPSRRFERAPFDWYVEEPFADEALFDAVPMLGTIGDPCCGKGTIPEVARARGFDVVAADIIDRGYPHLTKVADFLEDASAFVGVDHLVMNSPYSYRPRIAEAFARRALKLRPQTVSMLVPLRWLASEVRFTLFTSLPPSEIFVLSERPSMPPGHMIEALGKRAFTDGKVDYCWVHWCRDRKDRTETVWLPPRPKAARKPA